MTIKSTSKKPFFFILGAPKAGTTALSQYLSEHPDVFFSIPKEPNFFNTDFTDAYRQFKSEEKYLIHCFSGATDNQIIGEGSVYYLCSKVAVQNILKFQSEAKFIVMLRNPSEMAYSLHAQHLKRMIIEDVTDFETAWKLQEARKFGKHIPKRNTEPKLLQYREICLLGKQVKRVLEQVDSKQVLFLLFDDLKENPKAVYEQCLNFLGVQQDGRNNFPVVNPNIHTKSRTLSRLLFYISRLHFISQIKRVLRVPRGYSILAKIDKLNTEKVEKKPLPADFVKTLKSSFAEDIDLLESLIHRDLSHWK
jgi:hypothetical protein